MGKMEVKSEKGAKKGGRLLFLILESGLILGNAIRTRVRESIFSDGKAYPQRQSSSLLIK
jgi:hypothetical protein